MNFNTIVLEKKNAVAKITLNRPQVLNALNTELLSELRAALHDISTDQSIRLVVLTGAGRAFSAGADIKSIGEGRDEGAGRQGIALDVIDTIEQLDKPVIAAVHGYCLTGALELITACDLIVASEDALFGDTHARWGLTPTWGGSQRLPRIIGAMKAKEMVFTCEMLPAKEAERIGLVNKVVPNGKLDEALDELSKRIVANSRASIAVQKSLINRGIKMDYESALKMAQAESPGKTEDAEARLQAFMDRVGHKNSA